MKIKLILLLILIAPYYTKAQPSKDPYIPVLNENSVWYIANRGEFGDLETYTLHIGSTVIFDNVEYIRITYGVGGPGEGYLREDPDERKIYKYEGGTDKVYYDFSLEVGETIFLSAGIIGWFTVDAIEYIDTELGLRKAWYLSDNGSGEWTPVWIEGIGSLAGILEPSQQPNLNWWNFPELLCAENDGIIEYKSDNGATYGCQLESIGIDEFDNIFKMHLSPNPITDTSMLTFSNPSHEKTTLQIIDTSGRIVKELHTNTNNFSLKNTDYPAGIYYYKILNKQYTNQSKFIVL